MTPSALRLPRSLVAHSQHPWRIFLAGIAPHQCQISPWLTIFPQTSHLNLLLIVERLRPGDVLADGDPDDVLHADTLRASASPRRISSVGSHSRSGIVFELAHCAAALLQPSRRSDVLSSLQRRTFLQRIRDGIGILVRLRPAPARCGASRTALDYRGEVLGSRAVSRRRSRSTRQCAHQAACRACP